MLAARSAVQRPADAKLLVVDAQRNIIHVPRSAFVQFLRPNDLVIANDAATLPASLTGVHQPTGQQIEVRGVDLLEFAQGKVIRKDSFWKILE